MNNNEKQQIYSYALCVCVFSADGGTQLTATCWICAFWCFGCRTTARGPRRWADCWHTAAARWGGLWAAMSCWSPVNTLSCAAPLTTGTLQPPRGQVGSAASGNNKACMSTLKRDLFIFFRGKHSASKTVSLSLYRCSYFLFVASVLQRVAADQRCLVTRWRFTAPDWWWWSRWQLPTPPSPTPSSSWRKPKERDTRWNCIHLARLAHLWSKVIMFMRSESFWRNHQSFCSFGFSLNEEYFLCNVTAFTIRFSKMSSGPRGDDLLLPDSRLGGAHRHGGEPTPETPPPCVMWLQRQLQRGVNTGQPESCRQHSSSAQVPHNTCSNTLSRCSVACCVTKQLWSLCHARKYFFTSGKSFRRDWGINAFKLKTTEFSEVFLSCLEWLSPDQATSHLFVFSWLCWQ